MSLSSFVPSSCFHGYPSLCAVHYLSLPPFPSLSLSLCSYLSHFAFISASLPLSHTLLTPAFISFHFHLSFTFLSPSSLPFHHAVFFSILLMESERERGSERKVSYVAPINSAFLITFHSPNPLCRFHWHSLSFTCVLDGVVNSWALIPGLLLCSSGFRKKV